MQETPLPAVNTRSGGPGMDEACVLGWGCARVPWSGGGLCAEADFIFLK